MKLKIILIVAIYFALVISGCKKEEIATAEKEPRITGEMLSGLPGDQDTISGYLYADHSKTGSNDHLYLYAAFRDPSDKLLTSYNHYYNNTYGLINKAAFGNVNVGSVIFDNNRTLGASTTKPSFQYYYNAQFIFAGLTAGWTTESNKTFGPINVIVERGLPLMSLDSGAIDEVSMNGFTLAVNGRVSNYDSIVVLIDDNVGFTSPLRKGRGAGNAPIIFSENDFKGFWKGNTSGSISVFAFNYSHKVIDNRLYVFELSKKITQNTILSP